MQFLLHLEKGRTTYIFRVGFDHPFGLGLIEINRGTLSLIYKSPEL